MFDVCLKLENCAIIDMIDLSYVMLPMASICCIELSSRDPVRKTSSWWSSPTMRILSSCWDGQTMWMNSGKFEKMPSKLWFKLITCKSHKTFGRLWDGMAFVLRNHCNSGRTKMHFHLLNTWIIYSMYTYLYNIFTVLVQSW